LNAMTAIANGGVIYEPQVVLQVQDAGGNVAEAFEPRVLRHVNVPPEYLAMVAEGMHGATSWDDGTANLIFGDSPVPVAGKTGTAEYCERYIKEDGTPDCRTDAEGNQLTHAWFTAFAPYQNPEIALVVFVHGNKKDVIEGSEVAAPIARRIIDYYFSEHPLDPSLPVLPVPTPVRTPTSTPTPLPPPPEQPQVEEPPQDAAPQPTAPSAPTWTPAPEPTVSLAPGPEPTAPPAPQPEPPSSGNGAYRGTLLRAEEQPAKLSLVSGHVLDAAGNPIAGAVLTLDGGGAPVATLTTGPDGSFYYDLLNAEQSPVWNVRAPNLPGAPFVSLTVAPQQHYFLLFQEGP
ncbi:MAG: penicillin-binding transpeptidase domain-containing protein, partial [Ardenticatenaceae bacterium]